MSFRILNISQAVGDISYNLMSGTAISPVRIAMTDFKESPSMRTDDKFQTLELYSDVDGEINIRSVGPTATGIMYHLYRIEQMLDNAKKFNQRRSLTPTILQIDSKDCLMLEGSIEHSTLYDFNREKRMESTIRYKRRGLTGTNPTVTAPSSLTYASINSRVNTPFPTTSNTNNSRISSPADLVYKMFNMDQYVPSGYLLFSNEPIATISGGMFMSGSVSTVFQTYDETVNNAYSTRIDAVTGVLGFKAIDLNTYTTSGTVYGQGRSSTTGITKSDSIVEVFATVKTTFSGSIYGVSLITKPSTAPAQTFQTTETLIGNVMNPQVVYLGLLSTNYPLSNSRIQLAIRSTNIASGILEIDQIILLPAANETSRAIALNTWNGLATTELSGAVASGNIALEIYSNYRPLTANTYSVSPYPMLNYYRETATDIVAKVPTYYGNPLLMNGLSLFDAGSALTAKISVLMLATGSTYQTVSGLRYWTMSDRHNNKVRSAISVGAVQDPTLTLYRSDF